LLYSTTSTAIASLLAAVKALVDSGSTESIVPSSSRRARANSLATRSQSDSTDIIGSSAWETTEFSHPYCTITPVVRNYRRRRQCCREIIGSWWFEGAANTRLHMRPTMTSAERECAFVYAFIAMGFNPV
jgi:hypothetical protein